MELWDNLGYFTPIIVEILRRPPLMTGLSSHEKSPSISRDVPQENRFFPLGRIPKTWDVSTINPRSNGVDWMLREN